MTHPFYVAGYLVHLDDLTLEYIGLVAKASPESRNRILQDIATSIARETHPEMSTMEMLEWTARFCLDFEQALIENKELFR